MTFADEDYPGWKDLAERLRRALHELGHNVPQCLPGEPDADVCGANFAYHVTSYLATLKARVEFDIDHLGPAARPMVDYIYSNMLIRLRDEEGCGDPGHQPADVIP